MLVLFGLDALHPEWTESVVCIGTFDGVHRGHQAVIDHAVRTARAEERPAVLVTFDRHPAAVLRPEACPPRVAGLQENLAQFRERGVAVAVVLPFNAWLSRLSAQTFLDHILREQLRAARLVVGHDFALGNGREGTTDWLSERIPTEVVPPFEWEDVRVSSSTVRTLVAEGRMEAAAEMLGRPFALEGVIVGGQKLGRQLGYPTANLARSENLVLPADGVYAARYHGPEGSWKAALAIGTRPAVGGGKRSVEAYLLDYPGDSLYGQPARIEVIKRLREERNFPSLDALIAQMKRDVVHVRHENV